MRNKLLLIMLMGISIQSSSQEIWTIGPMMHVNFGGDKPRVSFGVETAYWNLNHFIYSIDGGIELEHKRLRVYSEVQTGIGLAGISAGPVLELNQEGRKAHLGFQTTAWLNYFLGVDFRKRWINHKHYNAAGLYGKIPISDNGSSDNNSGSSHHHWHWD